MLSPAEASPEASQGEASAGQDTDVVSFEGGSLQVVATSEVVLLVQLQEDCLHVVGRAKRMLARPNKVCVFGDADFGCRAL